MTARLDVALEAIHVECTTSEYHARDEWSNSQLIHLPDDPVSFNAFHVAKTLTRPRTAAMELGSDLHRIIFDGTPIVTIPPEVLSKSGSRAGAAWKDWSAEHADSVQVKADDPLLHMVASIRAEPKAMELLEAEGLTQYTVVYTDPVTGLRLRARPDRIVIRGDGLLLPELKTTCDPRPAEYIDNHWVGHFVAECIARKYHRQTAFYWDAVARLPDMPPIVAVPFIAVRNVPPYECVAHEMPGTFVVLGREQNRAALNELSRRLKSGNWNLDTHGRTVPMDPPPWMADN